MPILYALIDAAVLYSAALFVTLICTANNGEYVVVSLVNNPDSIQDFFSSLRLRLSFPADHADHFYMVLDRIAMRRNNKTYYTSTTTLAGVLITQDTGLGLRPLQVHISQFSGSDANPQSRLTSQDTERGLQSNLKRASDSAASEVAI
ncbi:hypothetical protein V8E55_007404 [Tylopilus felleus]